MGILSSAWKGIKSVGKSIGSGISGLAKGLSSGSGVLGTVGSWLGGVPGALISGAVDLGSNWLSNEFLAKPNAEDAFQNNLYASAKAFDQSYEAYKRRYQDTMADMKAAGLNPILAAGSGGFNVSGQPQMAKAESPMATLPQSSSAQSYLSIQQANTEKNKRKELESRSKVNLAKAKETLEKTANERVRRGLISEQEKLTVAMISKIYSEIGKMFHEVEKIGAETDLSRQIGKKIAQEITMLKQQFKQLKQTSDWYDGAYGDFLGWLRATLGSFGQILGPASNILK